MRVCYAAGTDLNKFSCNSPCAGTPTPVDKLTQIHTHPPIHLHTYTPTHTYTHTRTHTHTHTGICAHMYAHACKILETVLTRASTQVSIYTHACRILETALRTDPCAGTLTVIDTLSPLRDCLGTSTFTVSSPSHLCVCARACMYACLSVCMCVCIYIYVWAR
jgi:hypothetical protein